MYRFEPFIKYEHNGRVYENSRTDCENYRLELKMDESGISCKLVPHVKMKLIEFNLSAIKKFALLKFEKSQVGSFVILSPSTLNFIVFIEY